MDTEQRRSVFGKFYNQIEPGRINGEKLLQKIQKFEKDSLIDLLFKFISSIRWSEEDKRDIFFCHKKIAEKVEQKDPKGARKAMLEHLGDMGRILSRYPMKDVLE